MIPYKHFSQIHHELLEEEIEKLSKSQKECLNEFGLIDEFQYSDISEDSQSLDTHREYKEFCKEEDNYTVYGTYDPKDLMHDVENTGIMRISLQTIVESKKNVTQLKGKVFDDKYNKLIALHTILTGEYSDPYDVCDIFSVDHHDVPELDGIDANSFYDDYEKWEAVANYFLVQLVQAELHYRDFLKKQIDFLNPGNNANIERLSSEITSLVHKLTI